MMKALLAVLAVLALTMSMPQGGPQCSAGVPYWGLWAEHDSRHVPENVLIRKIKLAHRCLGQPQTCT